MTTYRSTLCVLKSSSYLRLYLTVQFGADSNVRNLKWLRSSLFFRSLQKITELWHVAFVSSLSQLRCLRVKCFNCGYKRSPLSIRESKEIDFLPQLAAAVMHPINLRTRNILQLRVLQTQVFVWLFRNDACHTLEATRKMISCRTEINRWLIGSTETDAHFICHSFEKNVLMQVYSDPTQSDATQLESGRIGSLWTILRRDPTVYEHRPQSGRVAIN